MVWMCSFIWATNKLQRIICSFSDAVQATVYYGSWKNQSPKLAGDTKAILTIYEFEQLYLNEICDSRKTAPGTCVRDTEQHISTRDQSRTI